MQGMMRWLFAATVAVASVYAWPAPANAQPANTITTVRDPCGSRTTRECVQSLTRRLNELSAALTDEVMIIPYPDTNPVIAVCRLSTEYGNTVLSVESCRVNDAGEIYPHVCEQATRWPSQGSGAPRPAWVTTAFVLNADRRIVSAICRRPNPGN